MDILVERRGSRRKQLLRDLKIDRESTRLHSAENSFGRDYVPVVRQTKESMAFLQIC
jgi:hypothetical protein